MKTESWQPGARILRMRSLMASRWPRGMSSNCALGNNSTGTFTDANHLSVVHTDSVRKLPARWVRRSNKHRLEANRRGKAFGHSSGWSSCPDSSLTKYVSYSSCRRSCEERDRISFPSIAYRRHVPIIPSEHPLLNVSRQAAAPAAPNKMTEDF